jgi:hypothetical protein
MVTVIAILVAIVLFIMMAATLGAEIAEFFMDLSGRITLWKMQREERKEKRKK